MAAAAAHPQLRSCAQARLRRLWLRRLWLEAAWLASCLRSLLRARACRAGLGMAAAKVPAGLGMATAGARPQLALPAAGQLQARCIAFSAKKA